MLKSTLKKVVFIPSKNYPQPGRRGQTLCGKFHYFFNYFFCKPCLLSFVRTFTFDTPPPPPPWPRFPSTFPQKSICHVHLDINQSGLFENVPVHKQWTTNTIWSWMVCGFAGEMIAILKSFYLKDTFFHLYVDVHFLCILCAHKNIVNCFKMLTKELRQNERRKYCKVYNGSFPDGMYLYQLMCQWLFH